MSVIISSRKWGLMFTAYIIVSSGKSLKKMVKKKERKKKKFRRCSLATFKHQTEINLVILKTIDLCIWDEQHDLYLSGQF